MKSIAKLHEMAGAEQTEAPMSVHVTAQGCAEMYGKMPLTELVERIVEARDAAALQELHDNRRLFRYGAEGGLRLVEYIDRLRVAAAGVPSVVADEAYSLTVDKFSRLPFNDETGTVERDWLSPDGNSGTDCRNYLGAFLKDALNAQTASGVQSELARELIAARRLRGMVRRHFELSLRERRRAGAMTRYTWRLSGGDLRLMMPRVLVQNERRRWLVANVPDPDPRRPGERERVQTIIDTLAPKLSWAGDRGSPQPCPVPGSRLRRWPGEEAETAAIITDLATTVADEKAESIHERRPSIQALGADRLRQMILRIFRELAEGDCKDGDIAADFQLSKASYSRFAGSRWNGDGSGNGGGERVPDLWTNTARALAGDPDVAEVAQDTGVWETVKRTARLRSPPPADASAAYVQGLYFIPLIAGALRRADREQAIEAALREARRVGQEPGYHWDGQQFRAFMQIVRSAAAIELVLEQDGERIGRLAPRLDGALGSVVGLTPGRYVLRLSTGRVVWARSLSIRDLSWIEDVKNDGESFPMAADTEGVERQPGGEWAQFGGELTICLLVGPGGPALEVRISERR